MMKTLLITTPILMIAMITSYAGCPTQPSNSPDTGSDSSIDATVYDSSFIKDASNDGNVTLYDAACYNLKKLNCIEGKKANCQIVLEHAIKDKLTNFNVACIIAAENKQDIRKCGNIQCE